MEIVLKSDMFTQGVDQNYSQVYMCIYNLQN